MIMGVPMFENKTMAEKVMMLQYCHKVHRYKYKYSIKHTKRNEDGVLMLAAKCPFHGAFSVQLFSHKSGTGCPVCDSVNPLSFEAVIELANKVHGKNNKPSIYKYTTPRVFREYDKLQIKCRYHGAFTQSVYAHLHGAGCPKCAKGIRSAKQYIKDANIVHKNKYTYENLPKEVSGNITIICPDHGKFTQHSQAHIGGSGCRNCSYKDAYFYIYLFKITNGKKSFYKLGLSNDTTRRSKELNRGLSGKFVATLMRNAKFKNSYGAFSTEYYFLSNVPGKIVSKKLMKDGYAETKDNGYSLPKMLELYDKLEKKYRRIHLGYNPERQMYASSQNAKRKHGKKRERAQLRRLRFLKAQNAGTLTSA